MRQRSRANRRRRAESSCACSDCTSNRTSPGRRRPSCSVERIDPCHHALDAANVRVRDVCGGSCREAARELGVAPVGVDLAIEAHLCEGARPTQPRVGRRARRRFDERQRGLEHGDAIRRHIRHLGDRQRLRDHFRLGRRRQQAHGRRRLDVGDEAEIDLAAAGCGAQLRDRLVEQRRDLAHVLGAVPVVLRRPLGELCARACSASRSRWAGSLASAISFSTRATSPVISGEVALAVRRRRSGRHGRRRGMRRCVSNRRWGREGSRAAAAACPSAPAPSGIEKTIRSFTRAYSP